MDAPAPNVGKEVGSAVLGSFLFPLLGEGTPLCSFFGTWREVAESAEQAGALGSDDCDRESAPHLVKQESTF